MLLKPYVQYSKVYATVSNTFDISFLHRGFLVSLPAEYSSSCSSLRGRVPVTKSISSDLTKAGRRMILWPTYSTTARIRPMYAATTFFPSIGASNVWYPWPKTMIVPITMTNRSTKGNKGATYGSWSRERPCLRNPIRNRIWVMEIAIQVIRPATDVRFVSQLKTTPEPKRLVKKAKQPMKQVAKTDQIGMPKRLIRVKKRGASPFLAKARSVRLDE